MSTEIESADDDAISRYVWRRVGKESARDMAKALGVSPDEILRVKRDLAESVDEITLQVQKARLMRTLQEIADDAKAEFETAPAEFKAGLLNSSVAAIKTLLVELNRTSKQDSEAVAALNQLRVRELYLLMTEVVETGIDTVSERHKIPKPELVSIFNEKLADAARRRELS